MAENYLFAVHTEREFVVRSNTILVSQEQGKWFAAVSPFFRDEYSKTPIPIFPRRGGLEQSELIGNWGSFPRCDPTLVPRLYA